MKNILTILKEMGIEVPKDKEESLTNAVAENYKPVADYDKQKEKLDAANETIKANDTATKDLQKKFDEFEDVDALKASKNQKEDVAAALKALTEAEDSRMLFGERMCRKYLPQEAWNMVTEF